MEQFILISPKIEKKMEFGIGETISWMANMNDSEKGFQLHEIMHTLESEINILLSLSIFGFFF